MELYFRPRHHPAEVGGRYSSTIWRRQRSPLQGQAASTIRVGQSIYEHSLFQRLEQIRLFAQPLCGPLVMMSFEAL
jgi:hypothetical protein